MKITILAAIWAQNLGDELILKNEIQFFQRRFWDNTKFSVFTYDLENPFIIWKRIKYYEYFPCNIKNITKIFRNIKNFFNFIRIVKKSDLIVIWWWGIFFDKETWWVSHPLKQWLFRIKVCNFFKKKICFHWVGISINRNTNLAIIEKIFSGKKREITVRDIYSQNLLEWLWIKSKIIADPVFWDNGNTKEAFKISYCLDQIHPKQFHIEDIKSYNFEWKTVGLSFRSGYFWEDDKIMKDIIKYILWKKWKIIFLPTSFHKTNKPSNDYLYLKKYADKYDIKITKNMWETYKYFRKHKIDIIFAMRLHSIILAQTYKIPYLAISYAKKTDEILKIIKLKSK
jgi:polysaccharide pyruvyl transferase WcaK-like protein